MLCLRACKIAFTNSEGLMNAYDVELVFVSCQNVRSASTPTDCIISELPLNKMHWTATELAINDQCTRILWPMYTNCDSTAQYFGATIVLLAISTSLTVLVLNVHHRGSLGNPVPSIVKLVVLNWLAKMLGLGKRISDKGKREHNITKMVWVIGKLISYN